MIVQSSKVNLSPVIPVSYVIFKRGSTIYAKKGLTGKIDNSGSDFATVCNWALDNLTSGRTWKEKVVVLGDVTLSSTSLLLPSYTSLEIQGEIALANGASLTNMIQNSDTVSGNVDIEIIGCGTLDGNYLNNSDKKANIYFKKVVNVLAKDIKVIDARGHGVEFSECVKIKALNLWTNNCGDDCISVINHSHDIIITDNFLMNGRSAYGFSSGIEIEDDVWDFIVEHNYVSGMLGNAAMGIAVVLDAGSAYGPPKNGTISNNLIVGECEFGGIRVSSGKTSPVTGVKVIGNTIIGTAGMGIEMNTVKACSVLGNTVDGVTLHGIRFQDNCVGVQANANTVINNGQHGIYFDGATDFNIQNNTCLSNGRLATFRAGVRITGSTDGIITGNRCSDDQAVKTQHYGLRSTTSDYMIIKNNNVKGNLTLDFGAAGANDTIKDNEGYKNSNRGTAIIASGNTFVDVTHGLGQGTGQLITPAIENIRVTPTNSMGNSTKFWISNVGNTAFRINVDIDPGATTATFGWNI